MTLENEGFYKILDLISKRKRNGYKSLIAAIILSSIEDATKINHVINDKSKLSKHQRNVDLARRFLTGNYSREYFKLYCELIDLDPNRVIKFAIQQWWSKGLEPKYFNE